MQGNGTITQFKTMEANFDRFCVYVRMNRFFEDISKQEYKINLIPPLRKLLDLRNMGYFHKGLRMMKENSIGFFTEILDLCLSLPSRFRQRQGIRK